MGDDKEESEKEKEVEKKDERKPKPIGAPLEEKKKIQTRHCGPLRDKEVSKNHGLSDLQTALHVTGVENHARTMRQPAFPDHCPPHLATGSRGLCGGPVQGCKYVCHTCEMGDDNAKGYSIGMKDLGEYDDIPLN